MSQEDLAKKVNVFGAVIGRYERDEVKPSIDVAAQIAEALQVSLDYLVGSTDLLLDKTIIKRIQEIQKLENEEKEHLYHTIDALLRDAKARKAYSK
jgi:transcriptional regulator with XRE-family HTH domain